MAVELVVVFEITRLDALDRKHSSPTTLTLDVSRKDV